METDMYCHLIYETNNTAVQLGKNSLFSKRGCHLETDIYMTKTNLNSVSYNI